jgi:tetratricopeptide (TPR) repeat protein
VSRDDEPFTYDRLCQEAQILSEQGQIEQSLNIFRQAILFQPDMIVAYFKSGLNALAKDNHQEACFFWQRSVFIEPYHVQSLTNLANSLDSINQKKQADYCYRRAITIKPDYASVSVNYWYFIFEHSLFQQSSLKGARRAILLQPNDSQLHLSYAQNSESRGDLSAAFLHYRIAHMLDCDHFLIILKFLQFCQNNDHPDRALRLAQHAVILDSSSALAWYHLGYSYYRMNKNEEAQECWYFSIACDSYASENYNCLGVLAYTEHQWDKALKIFQIATLIAPENEDFYINLGKTYIGLQQDEQSLIYFYRVLTLTPHHDHGLYALGQVQYRLGLLKDSEKSYRQAITLMESRIANQQDDIELAHAHCGLAFSLLKQEKFDEGWQHFEWRWYSAQLKEAHRHYSQPQWQGEPIEGKILFLYGEQGFGDVIQFCRYLPLVAEKKPHLYLQVRQPLLDLMKSFYPHAKIISESDQYPLFDYHCPLMSLPKIFKTNLATIPSKEPYLRPDPQIVNHWEKNIFSKKSLKIRVGIAWIGGVIDRSRSIDITYLMPLFLNPDLEFYSLQKDETEKPPPSLVFDYMSEMNSFAETAGFIEHLDLVITIDTAVAHLAAALGKPVWLLLHKEPCWRWLDHRHDSPWYPSMRLFRQSSSENWTFTVERLNKALYDFVQDRIGTSHHD